MTYDELVKKIKVASGRTDATTINAIPDFVEAAQNYLDPTLRIATMLASEVFNSTGVSVTPTNMLLVESVFIDGVEGCLVDLTTLSRVREGFKVGRVPAEDFLLYSRNGVNIEIVAPANVQLTGYAKPLRLSSLTQQNAYSLGAPNALYWLSLSYLSAFARDSEGASTWMALAKDEIDNLNAAHQDSLYVGGVSRVPVKSERYF